MDGLGLLLLGFVSSFQEDLRVRERGGTVLVLEQGELHRERGAARTPLGCTDPGGTGRVLDIAADPAGLVFVAAERGLFVLGPYVDVLDPVERLEGAPRGPPTAVHVDESRRVWLATDEEVGVLDPSFFWGRTLAAPALPGGGPYRVSAAPGAGVLLGGAGGERVLDPAATPPPRLVRVRVDGVEVRSGATLERAPGGELALDASGEGEGGATFRYRLDRHHVWRELPPSGDLPVPHPGTHTLEVVAVDQELERSAPFALRLRVAYPLYYDGRFVLVTVAVVAALAFALFVWRGRVLHGRVRPARALVSAALAVALALQVVAGIEPHGKGWPFIGFSMYTRAFFEGDVLYDERMVVLRPNGSEQLVPMHSVGLQVDEPWEIVGPLVDGGEPAMRAYLEAWLSRYPAARARGLQVQARRSRLTSTGPVAIAPLVLAHFEDETGG